MNTIRREIFSATKITLIAGTLFSITVPQISESKDKNDLVFTDVALEAGFQDRLSHGRALSTGDFNGDGYVDFYIGNPTDESFILLSNGPDVNGNITFRKGQVLLDGVSAHNATVVDYDNDGDPDIFIGVGGQDGIGLDHLFNNDNGVFTDVSELAGIRGPIGADGEPVPVATGSGTFADYDKDGDLDLFVAARNLPAFISDIFPGEVRTSIVLPDNLGWRDTLYRNNGDGTFTDVTAASGINGINSSMTSSWGDYDNDGWIDLFVPHSTLLGDPSISIDGYQLYRNNHDGTFTEVPLDEEALQIGHNAYWASIATDFNNDGWLDIMGVARARPEVPNDSHSLLLNHGGFTFTNEARSSGLTKEGETAPLTMACQTGDVNNDGYPDIIMGSGTPSEGGFDRFLLNKYSEKNGLTFEDVSHLVNYPAPADPLCTDPMRCNPIFPYRGHAAVFVDYDKDGDIDLVEVRGGVVDYLPDLQSAEPNRLFRNDGSNDNNWLYITLNGSISNLSGIGARIEVTSRQDDGKIRKIYKEVKAGSCFSASGPREVHIGLGYDGTIESLKVHWPSGVKTTLRNVDVNQRILVKEEVLYSEEFNDGLSSGWNELEGNWLAGHGTYETGASGVAISINDTGSYGADTSVIAKLTYKSGNKVMGILGRVKSGDTHYGAILMGSTARIFKTIDGKETPLGDAISIEEMTPGKSYLVGLSFSDNIIHMSVDGKNARVTDKSIKHGGIGLVANNTAMSVDYVAISKLEMDYDDTSHDDESSDDEKLDGGKDE